MSDVDVEFAILKAYQCRSTFDEAIAKIR